MKTCEFVLCLLSLCLSQVSAHKSIIMKTYYCGFWAVGRYPVKVKNTEN